MKTHTFANKKEVFVDETAPIKVGDLFVNLDDERQDEPFVCKCKIHEKNIIAGKRGGQKWAKVWMLAQIQQASYNERKAIADQLAAALLEDRLKFALNMVAGLDAEIYIAGSSKYGGEDFAYFKIKNEESHGEYRKKMHKAFGTATQHGFGIIFPNRLAFGTNTRGAIGLIYVPYDFAPIEP